MIGEKQTMSQIERYPVLFVGAGPGHPDLITVAGRKALEQADLIIYAGSLVPVEMLSWAGPETEKIDSASLDLAPIVKKMVSAYQKGLKVVRLHTGDPSLYGAIFEQLKALEKEDVPYRIIPGVTAAFAAAAALGLEYTLPEIGQTLILTRASGRTPVPEAEALAELARHRTSLVIYLSAGLADQVTEALKPAYGADAPAAIVYRASWPDEKIVITTVGGLKKDLEAAGIGRQALIMVGRVMEYLGTGKEAPKSKLYDAVFSHGFRSARGPQEES